MNDKRWYETLIENTPLAIILVGVFLFFVAAAGGLPSQQITIVGWWRVTLAIMGIISAASGVLLYWVERHKANGIERGAIPVTPSDASSASTIAEQPAIGSPIEGKYYAEGDVTYVNTISHLSDQVYKIVNASWDGVGLFDGEFYFGIYKYNNKALPNMRGKLGIHKAELCFEKNKWMLKVTGTPMNDSTGDSWSGTWFKATDD